MACGEAVLRLISNVLFRWVKQGEEAGSSAKKKGPAFSSRALIILVPKGRLEIFWVWNFLSI